MKVVISRPGLGAKRRHSCGYGEAERCGSEPARAGLDSAKRLRLRRCRALQGLQQRCGREDAFSCVDISGARY